MKKIKIWKHEAGNDQPCFIISEIGINHNNDLDKVKEMIRVTAETGCQAVKMQTFKASRMYPRTAGKIEWEKNGEKTEYDIFESNEKFEVPLEWWPILRDYSHSLGLAFLSSVCDEESADYVDEFIDMYKATSFAITHLPLLKHMAKKGKPIMVSTGTATLDEVKEAYEAIKQYNQQIIILHCISEYPTPLNHVNMAFMKKLIESFPDAVIGFSDHSIEPADAPAASIVCGAKVIEKHITLDRTMEGPDHFFALEPEMLKEMVTKVRETEVKINEGKVFDVDPIIMGTGNRTLSKKEQYLKTFARRSVMAARDLKQGERIKKDDIIVLRNGKKNPGLDPKWYDIILAGTYTLTKDVMKEEPLLETDIKNET